MQRNPQQEKWSHWSFLASVCFPDHRTFQARTPQTPLPLPITDHISWTWSLNLLTANTRRRIKTRGVTAGQCLVCIKTFFVHFRSRVLTDHLQSRELVAARNVSTEIIFVQNTAHPEQQGVDVFATVQVHCQPGIRYKVQTADSDVNSQDSKTRMTLRVHNDPLQSWSSWKQTFLFRAGNVSLLQNWWNKVAQNTLQCMPFVTDNIICREFLPVFGHYVYMHRHLPEYWFRCIQNDLKESKRTMLVKSTAKCRTTRLQLSWK